MSWYVCAISHKSPRNWDLCKEVGLYGLPTYSRKPRVNLRKGDHLLFWLTKKGYLGFGTVIDDPRAPNGREEAPWLGGVERFGTVVPFKLDFETPNPLFLKFGKEGQEITGVKPFTLQSGLALITDSAALQCAKLIQESIGTKGAE